MDTRKKLTRNISLLNILLFLLVVVVFFSGLRPLLDGDFGYMPPERKNTGRLKTETARELETPSPAEYTGIADANLFHPERIIPPEKKEGPPLPKPDFVLYGTMVTDDLSVAYLEDRKAPRNTPGRGLRQVPVRKGDTLSGFTLREIAVDRVVMSRGEETITVKIHADKKQKAGSTSVKGPFPSAGRILPRMQTGTGGNTPANDPLKPDQPLREQDKKVLDLLKGTPK